MKSGSRRFRYSSTHENDIPDGPIRRRMEPSSLTFPPPKDLDAPVPTLFARSSKPSSTCLRADVSGACCLTTSLEMAHRLSLLQEMALRVGTWERINRSLLERLRVRLKRDPLSPALAWWIASL